ARIGGGKHGGEGLGVQLRLEFAGRGECGSSRRLLGRDLAPLALAACATEAISWLPRTRSLGEDSEQLSVRKSRRKIRKRLRKRRRLGTTLGQEKTVRKRRLAKTRKMGQENKQTGEEETWGDDAEERSDGKRRTVRKRG